MTEVAASVLAVELRAVTRSYRSGPKIGPVDAVVAPGRALGLVGSNGAGKTTLLRMVCGLLAPDAGEIRVHGTTVRPGHPPESLGAMIEEPALYPWASARTTLELAAAGRREREERIDACLELVGLAEVSDRPVRGFSQGMRQRLGLARALLGQPRLLVLDEPSNGLDPQGIRWLRGLVRDQVAAGTTVIVSSHLLGELRQMVDEVIILSSGTVVAQLATDELSRDALALEDLYFSLLS